MKLRRKAFVSVVAALVATAGALVVTTGPAEAHGAMMAPGSRTFLCYLDGKTSSGQQIAKNPACAAAINKNGMNSIYNWFAVLRSNGAGRMSGFIEDGSICSGGTGGPYDFSGFNLARDDWPQTHLTAGANFTVDYNNWAKHPGSFKLYITKDSWSPTRALAWSDLESTPFSEVYNPTSVGGPGTDDGKYTWTAKLPSGKSGKHLIFSLWTRSDSQETFYGCSDVTFDGGNGQVTGVGDSTIPGSSQSPSAEPSNEPSGQPSGQPSQSPSTDPSTGGSCSATYKVTSTWSNGFQGEVVVKAPSDKSLNGWSVQWTWPGSEKLVQAWNGKSSVAGSLVTVQNEAWNGSLSPGGSAQIGFLAQGTAPSALSSLKCSAA